MQILAAIDTADRELARPVCARADGQPRGEGVDGAAFEAPPFFVRLASVKARGLPRERTVGQTQRRDVCGDVRRVLVVVSDDADRVLGRRCTVWIGLRPERGFAAWSAVDPDGAAL